MMALKKDFNWKTAFGVNEDEELDVSIRHPSKMDGVERMLFIEGIHTEYLVFLKHARDTKDEALKSMAKRYKGVFQELVQKYGH